MFTWFCILRVNIHGSKFLEKLKFPVVLKSVRISYSKFERIISNRINEECYEHIISALSSVGKWGEKLYYDFPSLVTAVYITKTIYIMKYRMSIEHNKKKKKWIMTFWGEFFHDFLVFLSIKINFRTSTRFKGVPFHEKCSPAISNWNWNHPREHVNQGVKQMEEKRFRREKKRINSFAIIVIHGWTSSYGKSDDICLIARPNFWLKPIFIIHLLL